VTSHARKRPLVALAAAATAFAVAGAFAQEPAGPSGVARQVHQALAAQIEALNAEDPDAVMALFHPAAPGLDELRRQLVALFRARDHRYTLERFKFVAEDGPYAYARCLQTTAVVGRPPGEVQRLEQLFVFRRADGGWKFWTSVVLREVGG